MQIRGEYREDKQSFVESRDGDRFNLAVRTAISPASRIPYRFENVLVCLTQSGTIQFTTDRPGVGTRHSANDILLLPAGFSLYTDYLASSGENPLRCLTLELDNELIREVLGRVPMQWPDQENVQDYYSVDDVSEFLHGEAGAAIRRIYAMLSGDGKIIGREQLVTSASQQLVLLLLQSHARHGLISNSGLGSRRFDHLMVYIRDHLHENLNVTQLAAVCHMSVSSFYEHFRRTFGGSPAALIRDLRIARARELLIAQAQQPLKWVARECGFRSVTHFSQVFKSHTASTPSEFRARHCP